MSFFTPAALNLFVMLLLPFTSAAYAFYTPRNINATSPFAKDAVFMGREVYSPAITAPDAITTWHVGSTVEVRWDASNAPEFARNYTGRLVLGYLDGGYDEHLNLDNPLADGFNITKGHVKVVVPNVSPADDYIVVLFGDSGNRSPEFTIML